MIPKNAFANEIQPSSNREKGIAVATFLVIIGLFLSKITGFLREILVSYQFPDDLQDAFTTAFYVPDLVYQLLVGGAIQAAITPSLARSIRLGEEKKGIRSVGIFISAAAVVMLAAVVIGAVFAERLYPVLYPNPDKRDMVLMAARASRILLPQVFFMMLAAFSIGILNAYKKFTATAMGPTVYNVLVLLSILFFGGPSESALYRCVIGIMLSALGYFLFQLAVGFTYLNSFRFSLRINDDGFKTIFFLAVPILVSSAIIQINTIVISSFASSFPEMIQFPLRNAVTLWQLPYGIFAVGVGTVMLPSVASHFAGGRKDLASDLLSSSLRNALFLTVPMTALLIMMPADIVSAVFRWNSYYTADRVILASQLLLGYSAAVIIHTVIFIYNQAYFAIGKTYVPLISGIINLAVVFILNFFLLSIYPTPLVLTVSYSVASFISAVFLSLFFRKDKELAPKHLLRFALKSSLCLLFMVVALYLANKIPFIPTGKISEILYVAARAVFGLLIYLICAYLLKMPELRSSVNRIARRFRSGNEKPADK